MMCLALGLGVLGFAALHRARRCHRHDGCHGYHGGCGGPGGWGHDGWHGRGGWHGGPPWARGGFARRALFAALAHLDASPAQERAIITEVDKLKERLRNARASVRDGRGDLAAAIRGSELDDAALGALLGRIDGATGEARAALLEAIRNIHAVLDDKQRAQLADLLERRGWHRGAGGGGPYRV